MRGYEVHKIILYNKIIPGWCNGSTSGSGPFSLGSNPSPGAILNVFLNLYRKEQKRVIMAHR